MSKTSNARRKGLAVLATSALVAGASLAGAGSAHAVADFKFKRLGGTDRYETASLVADEFAATNKTVILANGEPGNYADALSANTLAGELSAPILLTRTDKTPKFTLDQLKEDGVTDIYVVGGVGVVSAAQVSSLEGMGYKVTRVAGSDRFLTNAEVIKMNGTAKGATGLIATGFNFPDALAAGPISYQGHPLGLSATNNIEDSVVNALKAAGVTKVLIFGGESVVGPGVVAKLAANGITVEKRFAGADRSDTSQAAAEYALANLGFSNKHLGVASGYVQGFGADALAGGPLEGKEMAPMLVTRDVNNPDDVVDYMKDHANTLETGHLFGGTGAISASAQAAMEAAAKSAAASATTRPELTSARIVDTNTAGELGTDGTTVEYTFDEEIATAANGTAPVAGLFHVYNSAGLADSGDAVVSQSGNTVNVRFNALNADSLASALTVATIDYNAVEDQGGAESPEGDAALNTSTGGGTQNLPAGITDGPDLVSVGSFTADGANTEVAFTFDEAAKLLTAATDYHLIPTDGSAPINGVSVDGGDNTTTHIVQFAGTLNPANFARGTVDANTVEETTDNDANGKDKNVLQAADVSASGNTVDADLVSVALQEGPATGEDRALFTFDENVTVLDSDMFYLYKNDGTTVQANSAALDPANNTRVLASFGEGAIDNAVGGQTLAGAVIADAPPITGANEDDEVGVANTGTTTGQTAGKTNGPDLTGVSAAVRTDLFGNVEGAEATFTFDEAVEGPVDGEFWLFAANGERFAASNCTVPDQGTASTSDDTKVECEFVGPGGDLDRPANAVLGTVDNAAVNEAGAGTLTNPEGAERVS